MMNLFVFLYIVFLFVLLSPSILFRIPPNGSKMMVALAHGVIFAIILCLTHKCVHRMSADMMRIVGM